MDTNIEKIYVVRRGKAKVRSPDLAERDAALIKGLLMAGLSQHDVGAIFGVNNGRISEINNGAEWAHVLPADLTSQQARDVLSDVFNRSTDRLWKLLVGAMVPPPRMSPSLLAAPTTEASDA